MKRVIVSMLLCVGLSLPFAMFAAPAAGQEPVFVQLADLTTDAGGSVSFTLPSDSRPFFLTSLMYTFSDAYESAESVMTVDLDRGGVTRPMVLSTNFLVNTVSWNVERTHGQFYFRPGDTVTCNLSDTSAAVFTFSARVK